MYRKHSSFPFANVRRIGRTMGQRRSQHRFAISLAAIQIGLAVFYGVFVRYGGSADAVNFKDHKDAWQEMAITYPCEGIRYIICLFSIFGEVNTFFGACNVHGST